MGPFTKLGSWLAAAEATVLAEYSKFPIWFRLAFWVAVGYGLHCIVELHGK